MINCQAPKFRLADQNGIEVSLGDYQGKWVVLYFYPKDDTPGCTKEACGFSELKGAFKEAEILGISPDSSVSHLKFSNKHSLKLRLLSDPLKEALKQYEAWGLKKNYGKEYEGVIRSTFIIDPEGIIRALWRNVRVDGHMDKVLEKFHTLRIGC